MKKAILKTLIYAGIFDYPLKINEIQKWLIGGKATLRQVEKVLRKKSLESKVKSLGKYYFLGRQDSQVFKRIKKEKQSVGYFKKAKILSQILKIIPWVKLVGVSGGLAVNNAGKKDDIDLFIITSKNRLWLSRFLILGLLSLLGQRRKREDKGREIAGKICTNIFLEEDKLEQDNKDIFVAHEVLQMRPLWYRDGVYSKYLADNEWAFKFLPNWVSTNGIARRGTKKRSNGRDFFACENFAENHHLESSRKSAQNSQHFLFTRGIATPIINYMENLVRKWQLKIMSKPKGRERIEDGALYFHPKDCREEILVKYRQKLKKIISP